MNDAQKLMAIGLYVGIRAAVAGVIIMLLKFGSLAVRAIV